MKNIDYNGAQSAGLQIRPNGTPSCIKQSGEGHDAPPTLV